MFWPEYQVPSLAGREEQTMRFDGMRGLGDTAALEAAKMAKQKLAAIADAKERAKAQMTVWAQLNNARRANGLPDLPGSVLDDLTSRGVDATTAPMRVPKDSKGNFVTNPDGTYFVETITPTGPQPGVDVPKKTGEGMSKTALAAAAVVGVVAVVVAAKKFA